ncbi:hypothetical protein JOE23_000246 [Amphibacillus cookii]|nr:hypothetical protein [Amphibacillus cookii]
MKFEANASQQTTREDSFLALNPLTMKFILNSWAKSF